MSNTADLRAIADQLTGLVETSPDSEGRVPAWTHQANAVLDRLRRDHPDVRLPGHVVQYVRDAGARVRDPNRRKHQDRMMNAIIDELDRGELPSRGGALSFTPRQLVVIGFFAALVVVAIVVRGCAL